MPKVYVLKDKETGLFLTKGDELSDLTSTTRMFKHENNARKAAKAYKTYMWYAVAQLTKGKRGYRVDIGKPKFNEYITNLILNHQFEVVQIELSEINK